MSVASFGGNQSKEIKSLEKLKSLVSNTPCADQYKKDKAELQATGFSERTSSIIAFLMFEDCLEFLYGKEY